MAGKTSVSTSAHKNSTRRPGGDCDSVTRAAGALAVVMAAASASLFADRATILPASLDRLFDALLVQALALGLVGILVYLLYADDPLIRDDWLTVHRDRSGLPDVILDPDRRASKAARPGLWRRCGYLAAVLWSAAATVTAYISLGGRPLIAEPTMILAMALAMGMCGVCTAVAVIGPARARAWEQYQEACRIHKVLRERDDVAAKASAFASLATLERIGGVHMRAIIDAAKELAAYEDGHTEPSGAQVAKLRIVP